MNITTSIKLKAIILFIVFASNTILGFACAIGVNMAFLKRALHHFEAREAVESLVNVCVKGKSSLPSVKKEAQEKDDDCCNKKDDNCCNKKVVSFEQLDKTISQFVTANLALPMCELPKFLLLNTTIHSETSNTVLNSIFRHLNSPTEDIRVSIRSFQI